MAGRKPKLTPELQDRICQFISAGNYNDVAAMAAGIGETTFYRWLAEGEAAASGPKREFWEAIKKAEAQAEIRKVRILDEAAEESWQAASWWLERKHSDRWGRKDKQELTGKDGGPVQYEDVSAKDTLYNRVATLAERAGQDGGAREPD